MSDTQMVPFRMAKAGVEWLDKLAAKHQISRSDAIRMCLQYAKDCETDARVSNYVARAIRQGRITQVKSKVEKDAKKAPADG